MKKFYIALFSLFFFISLVGCQSKAEDPLEFSGETQSWSATVMLYPGENREDAAQINLNYLGGGKVESVGDFGINLDTSNNQNGIAVRDARLNKKGNFKEKVKVDVSKDVIKSEYMILTVKWNDRSEDIILKVK
ncbi:hypothetical protein M4D68_02595 [Priestia aryabhattai]|uniref:hypothetical protein n=1 Tax=Priestia aryabhattai TaxID=412384 RepID=UPI002040A7D4|nr:hypothetical protein [Priestia aryabhattai]MCM3640027.1 hypothetical protein [Priestia aryabhattai]